MDFLLQNWYNILATLGIPVAWFFGGRKKQNLEALETLQRIYDGYVEHDKIRTAKLEDRLEKVEEHNRNLQESFNSMQLSYALVVEESQKWQKKYSELEKISDNREELLKSLKKEHDKLKKEFEEYKKMHQ